MARLLAKNVSSLGNLEIIFGSSNFDKSRWWNVANIVFLGILPQKYLVLISLKHLDKSEKRASSDFIAFEYGIISYCKIIEDIAALIGSW